MTKHKNSKTSALSTKKIDNLLDDLDGLVSTKLKEINLSMTLSSNTLKKNEFESVFWNLREQRDKKISELKKEIYIKLNEFKNYTSSKTSDEDYEKIAKIIANVHDIVEFIDGEKNLTIVEKSILKLPEEIRKYFIPFKNFKEIKGNKTEGPYKFDGEGSFINYNTNNTNKIFVQATKTKNILEQTELIFKTSEQEENKKVYIISDKYPKEEIENYFKVNDDELKERLEQLRFLILSSKIYQDKVFNKNKTLEYFFSIIYFSSKGFDNKFNREMYKIYYDGEFDIWKIIENKSKKNSKDKIISGIELYLEDTFRYFNNNLKMESFEKDCYITEPMRDVINHLNGLIISHLENNKERNLLKNKIDKIEVYKTTFEKLPSEHNKKKLLTKLRKFWYKNKIKNTISDLQKILLNYQKIELDFNYDCFIIKLEELVLEELELNSTKEDLNQLYNLTDEEILNIVFYNYGQNFVNLMYEYKNRKNYESIKIFKKFILKKLIEIFNNFNIEHLKTLNKIITNTVFVTKGMQELLFEACVEISINNVSIDYINNFKIYLLSTIFYPQRLNNENYPKITEFLLARSINFKMHSNKECFDIIINTYETYKEFLNPVDFINDLNLSAYDLLQLSKKLQKENKISKLTKYIEYKLQEFVVDGRLEIIKNRYFKRSQINEFELHRAYPTSNVLRMKQYEEYQQKIINLELIFFELIHKNKLIAIFYIEIKDVKKNKPIEYYIYFQEKNYSIEYLSNMFELLLFKNDHLD